MEAKRKELERSILNLMLYYHSELREEGVADTKQVLATKIPAWIHLSEAQSRFVEEEVQLNPTFEILENLIVLVQSMIQDQTYNDTTMKMVLESLMYLRGLNGNANSVNYQPN